MSETLVNTKPLADLFTTGSDGRARLKETTNDRPEDIERGAIKYDAGKPALFRGAINYFPAALEMVAAVSTFGAGKYAWGGWKNVDEGVERYSDALVRHLISESKGERVDPDSGLPHAAHTAWNALARLELELRKNNDRNPERN